MVGIHKFRVNVFADWDLREEYKLRKKEHKELIDCQTIVIYTCIEQQKQHIYGNLYTEIPEIQIFELNGMIKQMITEQNGKDLFQMYTVEDKK